MKRTYKPRRQKIPLHLMWVRGAIRKEIVIKHYKGGKRVMTKYPDMSGIIASIRQRRCRNRFKEAVAYAKTVIADPVLKAEWQKGIKRRNGVYNKAIRAFMIKDKAAREREELLLAQQVRVAVKNAVPLKIPVRNEPANIPIQDWEIERNVFLETG